MHDTIEDLINSIYTRSDISDYVHLILKRFHSITLYLIEPYFPQKKSQDVIKKPLTDNYTLYDHGGHILVTPNDVYSTPLFACGEFLLAVEKALSQLINAAIQEIAILGDMRAKLFVWEYLEKLNLTAEFANNPLKLINYSAPESYGLTREAVLQYMKDHGMAPKIPRSGMPSTFAGG
jgi:hypothetical protein